MPRPFTARLTDTQWLLVLTVAAIALWTVGLGNLPLRDWDEGSHGMVARELTRKNNWLYLTFFDNPYFMKPPLSYWWVSLSYRLFGVSEWTSRLPMAMLTALGVPLLYSVTRELTLRRRDAVLTAGVYLTLLPVVRHGRLLMLDGIINTFFILLLFCLLKARKSPLWALGMGFCLAAIALTKGVLVLALWGIAGAYILLDRQWPILKNPYTWLGVVMGLSLVLGWYFTQWQEYGETFIQIHLGTQNFDRLSTAVEGNDGPPWYYLLEIVKYGFPWVLFWPGGLYLAWQGRQTSRGLLILTGTVLFLGLISAMGTKLPWYVMPLYPFFALAVGWQLSQWCDRVGAYPYHLRWLFGMIAIAGLGGMVYFVVSDPQWPLVLLSLSLVVTMAAVVWQLHQRDPQFIRTLLVGIYTCLLCLMLSQSWIWELNEAFPVVEVGAMVQEHTPPGQTVYTSFDYNRPSLDFYSDRYVFPVEAEQLQQFRQSGHYLLLDESAIAVLQIPDTAILDTVDGWSVVQP